MKYQNIENILSIENRLKFQKSLKNNSLAIFQSHDKFPESCGQNFVFKQNQDLFYLSGIDREKTILRLYPDCPNPLYKEVLFLRQINDHIRLWEGYKYTKAQAQATSGIKHISIEAEEIEEIMNN